MHFLRQRRRAWFEAARPLIRVAATLAIQPGTSISVRACRSSSISPNLADHLHLSLSLLKLKPRPLLSQRYVPQTVHTIAAASQIELGRAQDQVSSDTSPSPPVVKSPDATDKFSKHMHSSAKPQTPVSMPISLTLVFIVPVRPLTQIDRHRSFPPKSQ